MKAPVLYVEVDGAIEEVALPSKWVICAACDGEGRSSAHLGAFSQEDMAEEGPEFVEDYMAGVYDHACDFCGGSGKVREVDHDRLTPAQRESWAAQCEEDREMRAIERAERAFGA